MLTACTIAVSLLVVGGIPVDVKPLSGPSISGELTGIEADAIVIQREGQPETLPMLGLWDITPKTTLKTPASLTNIWVELIDGSVLRAKKYTVTDRVATVTLLTGPEISVPTRSIHTVRFRDHSASAKLVEQWNAIVSDKHAGDVIIIRRQESLDHLDGILNNVTDDTVQFEFDGDTIDVNRQKLSGIMYYHPIARELPARVCQVSDHSGSRWNARSLTLVADKIQVTTSSGIKFEIPGENLRKLDFSSGNTVWLSDLEPESVSRQPYVASRLPQPSLERLFQPRRDIGMSGKPLALDGNVYSRGLAMTSRTEMVFRLTDDYRHFHAVAGIDDSVRDGGNVQLVITGDDQVLLDRTVTGREKAFPIDLDITGVRRLKFLVDFGGEMDIADHLNLCDARITK